MTSLYTNVLPRESNGPSSAKYSGSQRARACKTAQRCWTWLDGGGVEGGSRDGGGGSDKGAAGKQSLLAHGASRKPFIACVVVDTRREGGMPAR